ncbi:hypothetical protein [Haladaptatus halobius]|jgi:hypothetical protein|uniref:hypothetical protein n=1 Tax=Haladaptatus halobius TaxID=2884875 RepID=UPI001D0B6FDD|nr:hypothetical protein [Haladaptatus halobius]
MDETKRRRLAIIWVAFAGVMAFYVLRDGVDASANDLLGLVTVALGVGLAALYYLNPGDVLSFE